MISLYQIHNASFSPFTSHWFLLIFLAGSSDYFEHGIWLCLGITAFSWTILGIFFGFGFRILFAHRLALAAPREPSLNKPYVHIFIFWSKRCLVFISPPHWWKCTTQYSSAAVTSGTITNFGLFRRKKETWWSKSTEFLTTRNWFFASQKYYSHNHDP